MEPQSIVIPEILAERVIGNNAPAASWVSDLATTPALMMGNYDRSSIIRFEARRAEILRPIAITLAREELSNADSPRSRNSADVEAVVRAIEDLGCLKGLELGKPSRVSTEKLQEEAAWMALELFAKDLEESHRRFKTDYDTEIAMSLEGDPTRMQRSFKAFAELMSSDKLGARERLFESHAVFQETLRLNTGAVPPAIWFWHGWILWRLGDDPIVAQRAVSEAVRLSGNAETVTRWLGCRLLARMHSQNNDDDAAFEMSSDAAEIRGDAITYVENAAYASKVNKIREARLALSHGLAINPLVALRLLADESALIPRREVLEALAAMVPKLRDSAQGLCNQWLASSKKVREISTLIGRGELVSNELMEGHHECARAVSKADTILAWYINASADASKRLLLDQARLTITREVDRCELLRRESEDTVENVQKIRDTELKRIQSWRDSQVTSARKAVRAAMKYETMLDQGCGISIGIAVAGVGAFAVIAAIGVIRGFAFGIDTTIGQIALGISITPIALFLLAQFTQGVAAMRIEGEIQKRVATIDEEVRKQMGTIDTNYREQITHHRQLLDDRSKEVRLCREALRTLNLHGPTNDVHERAA